MPRLDLTDDEARDLSSVLTAQIHSLTFELSVADIRQFKHELRERLDRLELVQARLARVLEGEETEAPGRSVPVG